MLLTLAAAAAMVGTPLPVETCQAALGGNLSILNLDAYPGTVDGAAIGGRDGLVALRRRRGDGLIVVRGGDFSGADFRRARLHNICFYLTNLSGTDWRGARARGIGFLNARLTGADLRGARMPRVLFSTAYLDRVDASGADFSRGRLEGTWSGSLQDLRLDSADLRRFRFACGDTEEDRCSHHKRISFRRADLTRAAVDSYHGEADWTGARLDRTEINLHQLDDLAAARLAGPLVLRGGQASVGISPPDYRALLPHLVPEGESPAPSFDCRRALSGAERQICGPGGGGLRRLDRAVAALYARARATDPGVRAGQRAWLRARDRCGDGDCLHQSYTRRKDALIVRVPRPLWARPGARALFVAQATGFDEAFRAGPLYRRLLPAIVGAARSHLLVRVAADGTIMTAGSAVGGNAHMCGLGGDRLRFDPATGWLSGAPVARAGDPAAWRTRPVPLLRFWGDRAEVYGNGHPWDDEQLRALDYMLCGARAGFDEMVRVPATPALLAQVRAVLYGMAGDGSTIWDLMN